MSKPQVSTTLVTLPPEIRLNIYTYLLHASLFSFGAPGPEYQGSALQRATKSGSVATSVLAVCRLFYREAHAFLLQANTFEFLCPFTTIAFSPFPDSALGYLRTVILGPYQRTAKAARADMAATRQFIQSACPRLETLSTRLWLVKHMGAEIDSDNDFAPVVDTTWFFDSHGSGLGKEPVRYTMGIVKTRKLTSGSLTYGKDEVEVYSVLFARLAEKEKRPKLFGVWASISVRALLNLLASDQLKGAYGNRPVKKAWSQVAVHDLIVDEWKALVEEHHDGRFLLE